MPPPQGLSARAEFKPGDASREIRKQWTNPSDVFSVLLILGGDVVARALAQSTGWLIGPPSFSFGWVAYSVNALVVVVGENKLMPEPDSSCLVINGRSGYARENKSWIIGRMVRDFEFWMDDVIRTKTSETIEAKWIDLKNAAKEKGSPEPKRPRRAGLCVSIYKPATETRFGEPADYVLVLECILVACFQLGLAAIPCGLFGDWGILMITAAGILLSSATASLTQWRREKWAGRRLEAHQTKDVILTKGNGSQHAIVVLGCEDFLDLEDLAGGDTVSSTSYTTRLAVGGLAVLWILLLITSSALIENTWFLLAIGGIGILFNIYVAGKQRNPRTNGLPVELVACFAHQNVMKALYQVEEAYPHVGRSMLDIFFPGELRPDEEDKWKEFKAKASNV